MPKRISSIKPRDEVRRGFSKQNGSKTWYVSLFARLIVMAVLICIAVNIRINYNQKAELLNREVARVEREIHEINREIENLKKRKEVLSSYSNISRRNTVGKMGLRHADPRQVRRTALIRRSRNSGGLVVAETTPSNIVERTAYIR